MDYKKIYLYLEKLNYNDELKLLYSDINSFESTHIIPSIRFDTAVFLNMISKLKNPKNILEIGFGSGTSSIFINKDIKPQLFTSLERDKNRFFRGINILNKYSITNIVLLNEDAFNFFDYNEEIYDLIFLDSVKREYINYLDPLKKILNQNGLLICDNIFFNGKIIEDNIEEKYKNGIELLKKFNTTLSSDKSLISYFLPIGDGISLSIKK